MESFDITVNGKSINSKEIHALLIKGQIKKAIEFVVDKTGCSTNEAEDVVGEIRNLSLKTRDKKLKTWKTEAPGQNVKVIDKDKEYQLPRHKMLPQCPKCGSTNVQWKNKWFASGLMKRFVCSRCGHYWR